MAAKELHLQGHEVVLHARNAQRKRDIVQELPWAEDVLVADLSDMEQVKQLASDANDLGPFNAIIHNAGVYRSDRALIFRVNVLAPYILTCLMDRPQRLIYLNSGMHQGGRINPNSMSKGVSYSDSKFYLLLLANAVARKWSDVLVNSVNPGWVPTKMGGKGAPDDLQMGMETQVWLATSEHEDAIVSGKYFYHQQEHPYRKEADDISTQDSFFDFCHTLTGVSLP